MGGLVIAIIIVVIVLLIYYVATHTAGGFTPQSQQQQQKQLSTSYKQVVTGILGSQDLIVNLINKAEGLLTYNSSLVNITDNVEILQHIKNLCNIMEDMERLIMSKGNRTQDEADIAVKSLEVRKRTHEFISNTVPMRFESETVYRDKLVTYLKETNNDFNEIETLIRRVIGNANLGTEIIDLQKAIDMKEKGKETFMGAPMSPLEKHAFGSKPYYFRDDFGSLKGQDGDVLSDLWSNVQTEYEEAPGGDWGDVITNQNISDDTKNNHRRWLENAGTFNQAVVHLQYFEPVQSRAVPSYGDRVFIPKNVPRSGGAQQVSAGDDGFMDDPITLGRIN
jgi:hypothetical protein